jgi:hypothetical protein
MMKQRESAPSINTSRLPGKSRALGKPAIGTAPEGEVPLQIMVPKKVRRQVGVICAERGESLRTMVLRGLQSVGVDIPDTELVDRRGRRRE